MTIYATFNPIGSTNPKDLIDNAQNIDYLTLGPLLSYPDRRGVNRLSWAGIEASFAAAQAQRNAEHAADQARRESEFDADQSLREVQFNAYLDSTGFENPPLNYVDGSPLVVARVTQLVVRSGNLYTVRRPASFPYTLTGTWATDQTHLVLRNDQSVRQDLASYTDPLLGSYMVGGSFRVVNVKDYGAVGDGVTDDTAAIQAALNSITNSALTTQQRSGGATLVFPVGVFLISKPLVMKSVNTTIRGACSGASILRATTGTFSADVGSSLLGRWMIIWDAAYTLSGDDLYNCHIFDMSLDFNNRTDVKGIWIGGGRNSSSIERITFIRFYTHLIELGKSARDIHSITQGFLVSNCSAIWDGNVGQHTVDRDGLLFVISGGNENTFFNVDAVSGAGETSIGTAFMVGSSTYNCGGNRFIACTGANLKAAHITVGSVTGFVVGETVTTGDGYKGVISSVVGSVLKVITPTDGTSKYVPRASDTIVGGTSGATTTITSAVFGKIWHLANSWSTIISDTKAIEASTCGVFMDYSTAGFCNQNVVRGGRFYAFTASCYVAFGRSQFNRCEADVYTSPVSVLIGAQYAATHFHTVGSANAGLIKFISTDPTNSAIEYLSTGGLNVRNSANTAVFEGKNGTGGVKVDAFQTTLFDAGRVRITDRDGNFRLSTENAPSGDIALFDSTGNKRVIVNSDGTVTVNAASGKNVVIQQNGVHKIAVGGSGSIHLYGLTTAVPSFAEALYKLADGTVKITAP